MTNIATHNGTWTVTVMDEHTIYRVKTETWGRQRGRNNHQRVLSIKMGSNYTNVGFVRSDGCVNVWQRFSANEQVANQVDLLVSVAGAGADDFDWEMTDGEVSIEAATLCRVCNRQLTTPESIRTGIGPVCAQGAQRDLPDAEDRPELVTEVAEEREREIDSQAQREAGRQLVSMVGHIKRETDRAILFEDDRPAEGWLPKSQITVDDTDQVVIVTLPRWLRDRFLEADPVTSRNNWTVRRQRRANTYRSAYGHYDTYD